MTLTGNPCVNIHHLRRYLGQNINSLFMRSATSLSLANKEGACIICSKKLRVPCIGFQDHCSLLMYFGLNNQCTKTTTDSQSVILRSQHPIHWTGHPRSLYRSISKYPCSWRESWISGTVHLYFSELKLEPPHILELISFHLHHQGALLILFALHCYIAVCWSVPFLSVEDRSIQNCKAPTDEHPGY